MLGGVTPPLLPADRIAQALSVTGETSLRRKVAGAIYTPAELADLVVARALAAWEPSGGLPRTVLDPACGAGHFLVAAWRAFRERWRSGPPPVARLCGIEIDAAAAAATRQVLEACAELDRAHLGVRLVRPNVRVADALATDPAAPFSVRAGFDLVVGNPPYVRIDRLSPEDRARLANRFGGWLTGKWDLYHCFLARGLDLLAPGGVLAFVTPNQYFLGRSAAKLRAALAEQCQIREAIDLCGLEPFDRAIPPAAVTVLRRAAPGPADLVRLAVCLPGAPSLAVSHRTGHSGEVAQSRWRNSTWSILAPEPFLKWLDRLDAPTLGDLCTAITEGDTKRAEEARVAPASEAPGDWWPIVRGRDVSAAGLTPGGDRLPPRPGAMSGRVLVRDVAPRLVAAAELQPVRCLRTVYCLNLKDTADARRLASLLNTDLLTWIYVRLFYSSKMSPRAANFRFQSQFLGRLPIVLPPPGADVARWAPEAYAVPPPEQEGIRRLLARLRAL
jgi:SAM-dependent methyltransferase